MMTATVQVKDLKPGDYFARGSNIYRVLNEPGIRELRDDEDHDYTLHALSVSGVESFWESHHWDYVRPIDKKNIEDVKYVAVHLGSHILRFIDEPSLKKRWEEDLEDLVIPDVPRVHKGTILDQDRQKTPAVVVMAHIKAVSSGSIIIETNTKRFI